MATDSIDCAGCKGEGRDPFSSWDEPRPCPECGGDGLTATGRRVLAAIGAAEGALCSAGNRVHRAEMALRGRAGAPATKALGEAARSMREIARLLDDAADAAEGHAPESQARIPTTCHQHVNPPGHPARDARCALPMLHDGPCAVAARAA